MNMLCIRCAAWFLSFAAASAQSAFPYRESFDTARAPLLPSGWTTTKMKSQAGDFTTSASTSRSTPQAALSTDARIAQCLVTPPVSFSGKTGAELEFYERRSSTFTAGLLVEGSVRDDTLSWVRISDTLTLVNSSSYVRRVVPLPSWIANQSFVRFRWRTLGNGAGATGTLRIDDVGITVARSVDLALDTVIGVPSHIAAGSDVPCTLVIRNKAREGSYGCRLTLVDSSSGGRIIADSTFTQYFNAADSACVSLTYAHIAGGIHRISAALSVEGDEDPANNSAAATIMVAAPSGAIVINEIMYEPAARRPEYVELYNRGSAEIDLAGWNMGDASGTTKNRATIPLPRTQHMLRPYSMCVVASDSSILDAMAHGDTDTPNIIVVPALGLNNSGDDVLLFDPSGATADSVSYLPAWHMPKIVTVGKSLERINPNLAGADARNWSTSVAVQGGTPGSQNSVYTSAVPSDASLVLSPNPFSPNSDGVEDFLSITYLLPTSGQNVRVRIYDLAGRLVRTLANNEPSASSGTIMWNGRDDSNTRVRMGMYVIVVEAVDPRGGVVHAMKGVAVVATRLY